MTEGKKGENYMNANRDLNARRWLFGLVVATLLIGILAGPLSKAAYAQNPQTTTDAQSARVESSLQIPASGTVTDPSGTISISGYVIVNCTRVIDATADSPPQVVLDFDFSRLRGTSGSSLTSLKLYVTGENQTSETRPLQASDVISVTCPYFDMTKDILSASSWLVTTTLNFNLATGKITSGTATVGTKPSSL